MAQTKSQAPESVFLCSRVRPHSKNWYMMSLSNGSGSVGFTCITVFGDGVMHTSRVFHQILAENFPVLEHRKCSTAPVVSDALRHFHPMLFDLENSDFFSTAQRNAN